MIIKTGSLLFLAIFLQACVTGHVPRGNVAMRINSSTAHICVNDYEVKVGDTVMFLFNDCFERNDMLGNELDSLCELFPVGEGRVTKIINKHYAEVKTKGTFKFDEGTLVEKVQ